MISQKPPPNTYSYQRYQRRIGILRDGKGENKNLEMGFSGAYVVLHKINVLVVGFPRGGGVLQSGESITRKGNLSIRNRTNISEAL